MAYSAIIKPKDYFEPYIYTPGGSGGHTNSSLSFQPDWVWFKLLSGTESHGLYDAVRGVTKRLKTNSSGAQTTEASGLTSFTSNGWVTGADGASGSASQNYVSWNWKAGGGQGSSNTDGTINSTYTSANTTSGFSIVSYTGTNATATVGHGLGVAPKMIIWKELGNSNDWCVWQSSLTATQVLVLNDNGPITSDSNVMGTLPTSSVFSIGQGTRTNRSGGTYIAYCFADVKGFSKVGGSYTGNGNADGTFVYTGFKPAWLMFKKTNGSEGWIMIDTTRGLYNAAYKYVLAESNAAEAGDIAYDILSNGFKFRGTSQNGSGDSFIYVAFAENPFVANTGQSIPTTAR